MRVQEWLRAREVDSLVNSPHPSQNERSAMNKEPQEATQYSREGRQYSDVFLRLVPGGLQCYISMFFLAAGSHIADYNRRKACEEEKNLSV